LETIGEWKVISITKLANKWRDESNIAFENHGEGAAECVQECADELESALPKWTRITDDPATWPEAGQKVFFCDFIDSDDNEDVRGVTCFPNKEFVSQWIGDYWRPLTDLDYPPEQQS
jgi:hypothetical protein